MSLMTMAAGLLAGCSAPAPSPTAAPAKPQEAKPTAPTPTAVAAAPAKPAGDAVVLRFGTPTAPQANQTRAIQLFGEELEKLSSGQFKVEVYPASQLGGQREMLEAVQLGTQSMMIATPAWAANFAKKMDVMSLPYLVTSSDKLFPALDGDLGKRLNGEMEQVGITVLGWWATGSRNVLNNIRPVNTPDDLQGMKLRVQASPVWVQSFRALGANPVSMDFPEVYSALQQRTIDGFENIFTDIYTLRFYEVTRYLSLTAHAWDTFGVYINKKLFDGFAADQQRMIAEAMKKATEFQRKTQAEEANDALEKLRGLMQVNDVSEADRNALREKVVPVYAQFENELGKDLIDQAMKALG